MYANWCDKNRPKAIFSRHKYHHACVCAKAFFWKKSPIKYTCWFKRLKHDQLFCDFFLQPLANQLMKSAKCSAVTRPLSFFLINTMIQSSQMTWQVFFSLGMFPANRKSVVTFFIPIVRVVHGMCSLLGFRKFRGW